MMKKLALSLLAIGCSLLTFISCSEEKDAFQLYSEMNQALEQVSSIQGSMDIDMKLTASKETLDLAMDMDITAVKRSETDADLAMKIESDMAQLGSFTMQAYTKDGYMYLDMLGMKDEKAPMTRRQIQMKASCPWQTAIIAPSSILQQRQLKNLPLLKQIRAESSPLRWMAAN